ncbi:TetR/AcrR family transcriptional regulator [Puniceibacterium confluentis]|uniref:TetR/AcrR family transcriptional regulator n=2 Tax=Puniceibacterium confluentis TaxID=1958944 RepID=UPI0011B64809|nr:TetR/AcrR family transcriptional regulator [Puniceibacterium confluentis]
MALLDAAESLFAERGMDATSVAEIAALSGCSVGSVYHHFRDKTALLHAILERLNAELRDTMRQIVEPERWQGAPIRAILHGYLEFLLEVGRSRPSLKVLDMPEVRQDSRICERLIASKRESFDGLYRLLSDRRAEITHPDPDVAIRLVLDLMMAMLKARAGAFGYPSQLSGVGDSRFADEVVLAAAAYLGLPESA